MIETPELYPAFLCLLPVFVVVALGLPQVLDAARRGGFTCGCLRIDLLFGPDRPVSRASN